MSDKLTMGSLFAGVGGFDAGFEAAGFESRWCVEWDEKAQCVLRRHFSGAQIHGDITKIGHADLEPVDVITYGFPCQDLSVAGKRAGMKEGTRSGLFYEAMRIIRELRPRFCLFENVPGLFSSDKGRDFGRALYHLAECGYRHTFYITLDSKWFGLAQRRRRVFGISSREVEPDFGTRCAEAILAVREGLHWDFAESGEAGKETTPDVGTGVEGTSGSSGITEREREREYVPQTCGSLTDGAHCGGGLNGQDAYTGRIIVRGSG